MPKSSGFTSDDKFVFLDEMSTLSEQMNYKSDTTFSANQTAKIGRKNNEIASSLSVFPCTFAKAKSSLMLVNVFLLELALDWL